MGDDFLYGGGDVNIAWRSSVRLLVLKNEDQCIYARLDRLCMHGE
jgi:hypothetical protein